MWCLIGCAIGDMGTILYFQLSGIEAPVLFIMTLAIFNGLLTSIMLETIILLKQMGFANALKTALGMSLISMVSMEVAMNLVDYLMTGGGRTQPGGRAGNAAGRVYHTPALQLLAAEGTGQGLPLGLKL